jgi:hypothetical protein
MIGGTIFGEPSVDYHYHVISQPFSIIAIAHPPTTFDHTPSKVTTEVGEAARTEIRNITFNDEEAVAPLEELRTAYPNADIYLNGQLTIDFPEDIKIPIEPNQMVTASVVGSSVKFSYCGLERAIAYLNVQYAVGTLEIKVVQPRAKYYIYKNSGSRAIRGDIRNNSEYCSI